jgi:hypothetical protein
MGANFRAFLSEWVGQEITVVNPESYKLTALGKGLTFQTYPAKLAEMGDDFIKLSFMSVKQDAQQAVEQIVPIGRVKRLSQWADEKLLHL